MTSDSVIKGTLLSVLPIVRELLCRKLVIETKMRVNGGTLSNPDLTPNHAAHLLFEKNVLSYSSR